MKGLVCENKIKIRRITKIKEDDIEKQQKIKLRDKNKRLNIIINI